MLTRISCLAMIPRCLREEASALSPVVTGRGPSRCVDQGVIVTLVPEAVQLLASSVSTTVFVASAHASTK